MIKSRVKIVVSCLVLILFTVIISGCIDYKSYDIPNKTVEETELVAEIAKIEQEIAASELEAESAVPDIEIIEEVVLPALTEPKETDKLLIEAAADSELEVITVKENDLISLKIEVEDPDQDKVSYEFGKPLDNEGKWKTNYGDAGEYVTSVTATDGKLTTAKKIKIVVERLNVPPLIGLLKDIWVKEGETVNLQPNISDPNGDEITVAISDPLTGGIFATDHSSSGEYKIKVKASDGELESEKIFLLTVEDVNSVPILSGVADVQINEGETVKIIPQINDLYGDKINLKISEPVGDDGEWNTKYTDHGKYETTLTVSDGKEVVTKKIIITVIDVNMPPKIISIRLETG